MSKNKVELSFPDFDPEKMTPEVLEMIAALEKSLQEHLEKSGCLDDLDDPPTTDREPSKLE
jgi:hypothetical protein